MSGNKIGGLKAAAQNIAREPDFYRRIGRIGGSRGKTGGFATFIECNCHVGNRMYGRNHAKNRCAGYWGGRISKRKNVA